MTEEDRKTEEGQVVKLDNSDKNIASSLHNLTLNPVYICFGMKAKNLNMEVEGGLDTKPLDI